ncbi:Uncharacterized protein DBV15_08604 [Temnothorax longispinosus]|uniref:Uncharacterized protein n=1 Tax=Temnothorax longispinosus TaxID=300112 RepID=A0A4S2KPU1_9HYME|nr:Uncharacterized protein DBV15_08604 [Temnothorax longispinosus]
MSGVGFLATVKTFAPGGRRRRRCEKQQKVLELPPGYGMQPDVVPPWDTAPPITPPAAFLPPGYKKGFPGELSARDPNKSVLTARRRFLPWTEIKRFCREKMSQCESVQEEKLL